MHLYTNAIYGTKLVIVLIAEKYFVCSTGANCAGHFLLLVIGWTWKTATSRFHKVEQGSIVVCMPTNYFLWVFVHTLKGGAFVVESFGHEVPNVLRGPPAWA